MRFFFAILAFAVPALPAEEDLTRLIRAISDYERVQLSPKPELPDALKCLQSQAAALPGTRPAEAYLVHYRKGYCELTAAILSGGTGQFHSAAVEFDRAIQAWPASPGTPASALPVLAAIARLEAGRNAALDPGVAASAAEQLRAAVNRAHCPGTLLMPVADCQRTVELGRLWLAWLRGREGDFDGALRVLSHVSGTPWQAWFEGRQAMRRKEAFSAAARLDSAAKGWTRQEATGWSGPTVFFAPRPDLPAVWHELGHARLLADDVAGAVTALDTAIKQRPRNASAIYLRAVAKERLGQEQPALADYELASRTAFANVGEEGEGGRAHLYRGILLFRRGDYARAENEFASALNFDSGPAVRPDVQAWRHMAAVAAGACGNAAVELESAMAAASALFPAEQARSLITACRRTTLSQAAP